MMRKYNLGAELVVATISTQQTLFFPPQFPHSHTSFHCKQCFTNIFMAKTVSSDTAGGIERRMLRLLYSSDKLLQLRKFLIMLSFAADFLFSFKVYLLLFLCCPVINKDLKHRSKMQVAQILPLWAKYQLSTKGSVPVSDI